MVRTRLTKSFKTMKGVRQECVMSPLPFKIYMELKEKLEKREIGGVGIGSQRIWNLAYADDIVLVVKNREAMMDMMLTLKVFLKDRRMEQNTDKSKILIFNRKGREKMEKWVKCSNI